MTRGGELDHHIDRIRRELEKTMAKKLRENREGAVATASKKLIKNRTINTQRRGRPRRHTVDLDDDDRMIGRHKI